MCHSAATMPQHGEGWPRGGGGWGVVGWGVEDVVSRIECCTDSTSIRFKLLCGNRRWGFVCKINALSNKIICFASIHHSKITQFALDLKSWLCFTLMGLVVLTTFQIKGSNYIYPLLLWNEMKLQSIVFFITCIMTWWISVVTSKFYLYIAI